MRGVYVQLARWPNEGHLQVWGRAADGWWGLLTWTARIRLHGDAEELEMAAWVPAVQLRKPHWSAAQAIPRIRLPDDARHWPQPADWDGWFVGVWAEGAPSLPPGAELRTGPAWQR